MRLLTLLEHATLADAGWAAAIVVDGKIFPAEDHLSAYAEYFASIGEELDPFDIDEMRHRGDITAQEGFLAPEGVFLSREEAISRWRSEKKASQLSQTQRYGDSSDLYRSNAPTTGVMSDYFRDSAKS